MRSLSVRTLIFAVLTILTAIPILWLGRDGANRFGAEIRAWHDEGLSAAAKESSHELRQLMQVRIHDLEVLARHLEATAGIRSDEAATLLRRHWTHSGYFTGMYLADSAANVISRAIERGTEGDSPMNYSDRDYYQALIRTNSTAVSKAQLGRIMGAPNIQIATPIRASGRSLEGYVEGSLSLQSICELVSRHGRPQQGSAVIVLDSAARIVADSRNPEGSALNDGRAIAAFGDADGPSTGRDESGQAVRAAAASVDGLLAGWRVIALEPQAAIDESADAARRRTWLATGIAFVVALLLSYAIAHWVGRRFSGLADTVQAIGRGEFARRTTPLQRFEPREIEALLTSIDKLAGSLQKHTGDLESLVSERTVELAKVNARLEMLVSALEKAGDGIEITDSNGRYVYVNPALERISGYSASELLGQHPSLLRSGQLDEAFYKRIEAACTEGRVFHDSFVGKRKDGGFFDQEVTVWPVQDAAGTITHIVGLRRDITQRKRTEQALRVSERMASLGTLASGVAHEINNPLTYLMLSLRQIGRLLQRNEALLPKGFADKVREPLEYADEGAQRVAEIVNDLRAFSRPNDVDLRTVDADDVIDSALRMVGSDIKHRATLERRRGDAPKILVNPARLGQVVLNLLVNALHAIEERSAKDSWIRVATGTDEDGAAMIEISDSGVGIAEENIDRIFDPFFTTKRVGVGTGLGLSVSHSMVAAMGGRIEVETQLGTGSTFRVCLPAATADTDGPRESLVDSTALVASCRLLVVDDDANVAHVMASALDHHHVTVARSAQAALALLTKQDFDLVLCDVMMPGKSGPQLFHELIAKRPAYAQRFVLMTGGELSDATKDLARAHDVPCLLKPLSSAAVERTLQKLLRRSAQPGVSSASA
jgi:PAS domain S-box-containing protein